MLEALRLASKGMNDTSDMLIMNILNNAQSVCICLYLLASVLTRCSFSWKCRMRSRRSRIEIVLITERS